MDIVCYACATALGARDRIGRRETCPRCGVDLHSCRQCRLYDPQAYNACREPQAERVLDKERANFCDYFTPGPVTATAPRAAAPTARAAADTDAAESPSGRGSRETTARAELERMFRKR